MSYFEKISAEQVRLIIKPIIKSLNDLNLVNDEIIDNVRQDIEGGLQQLLEERKISSTEYTEMMIQNTEELGLRIAAGANINQQLQRMEALNAEANEEQQGFNLPNITTGDELKKLMVLLRIKIALTENKTEKLLYTTLFQTVEACKNRLDEKGTFDSQIIPLLKSEEQYILLLQEQMNHFKLDKLKLRAINNYLEQFNDLGYIKNKCMNDTSISDDEKRVLQELCDNLSAEVRQVLDTLMTPDGQINEKDITQKISEHLDRGMAQSKEIPITSGFKGFINLICEIFKADPVFTITNSSIIDKIKSMKSDLFALKGDNPEVNEGSKEFKT